MRSTAVVAKGDTFAGNGLPHESKPFMEGEKLTFSYTTNIVRKRHENPESADTASGTNLVFIKSQFLF